MAVFDREALARNLAIGIAMLLVVIFTGWNLFNLLFVYWLEITLVLIAGTVFSLVVYIRAVLEKTTGEEQKAAKHGALEYLLAFVLAGMLGYFMFFVIIIRIFGKIGKCQTLRQFFALITLFLFLFGSF